MRNPDSRYLNFILTVIAALLLVLALRAPVGLGTQLPAQDVRQERDPQSSAIREVASSLRSIASATDGVADSNRRIAEAIAALELQVDVHPE